MSSARDSSPLIAVRNLTVSRGQVKLLDKVNWSVRAGEHWAVLGGNGAGKSTLLQAAVGLIWPDQSGGGEIVWHLGGQRETSPLPVRAAATVISPQIQANWANRAGDMSGEDLLLCGLYKTPCIYQIVKPEDLDLVRKTAVDFGLSALLPLTLEAMSQGQLRRMLIASACLGKPRILVLDEAADGLDASGRRELFLMLARLAEPSEGNGELPITLLMAAHREEDLPVVINRALYLESGRVAEQSAIDISTVLLNETPPGKHGSAQVPLVQKTVSRPPVLELDNVSVYLGRCLVLKNLSWRVEEGQHWAVLGPNGSGKTTLLRLVWGEIPAALGGELRWYGKSGPFNIPALRRGLGLVSDRLHQVMPGDMLAEDVVLSGFFGSIGLYAEPAEDMYLAVRAILERMGLEHLSGRTFGGLSFGEGRRLLLARALVHRPRLVLLDEACSGLDTGARAAFLNDISRAARTGGTQVIQISHHSGDLIAEINRTLYLEPVNNHQP